MRRRHSEEDIANEVAEPAAEVEDIEALNQALAEEKARAESNLAGWQRVQADFINYKRRVEQEMQEIGKLANANLVLNLLPILDDLERALASVPDDLAEVSWVDGIRLIDRKIRGALEAMGLSRIEAIGEPFDPNIHEAVMPGKGKEGIVVEELEKGYMFQDKIIRPTKVVVGSGEENKEA